MIYLDTSCLLKLLRDEPESPAVDRAVAHEPCVVISEAAELETLVQLKAGYLAGEYSKAQWRRFEFELHHLRNQEPFAFRKLPSGLWEIALRQHRNSGDIHCRTMDRLHLAAAEKLGIPRIMTHDSAQAKVAHSLNLETLQPGR